MPRLQRIGSFVGTRYDGKVVEALVAACSEGQIGIGTVKLLSMENGKRKMFSLRKSEKASRSIIFYQLSQHDLYSVFHFPFSIFRFPESFL